MATRTDDLELAAARKGGTTRLLGLIGGGLGLLAVGAGGAYFMFGGQGTPAPAGTAAAAAPGHGEAGEHGAASAVYLAFDPFVVNFEEDGTVRFLQVTVEVLVGSEPVAEQVRRHMPVLRDRMILLLSSQTYASLSTREGKEALRAQALEDLRALLKERLGADTLDGLYFTGFVMQ